jgi:hypothetical protein
LETIVATTPADRIADADAYLADAGLPTYTDLLAALQAIVAEAGPRMGLDDTPGTINTISRLARATIARAAL